MGIHGNFRRFAGILAATSSLLLSGCLFTPGKFTSELVLQRGGEFSFAYDGEISMAGLNQLAKMDGEQVFEANCIDDETYEQRNCKQDEIDQQREEWEAKQAQDEREKQQFARMLGGIDMSDPDSAEQLADQLRKQKGWKQVDYQGDGLFVVSFAVSGNLTHGFAFPTVEQMPAIAPFIGVYPRNDGNVRVDAPAFGGEAVPGMGSGMGPGMGMLAAMGSAANSEDSEPAPAMVLRDGTFAIVTNGNIRANNTDEGPTTTADGYQRLEWKVDARSQSAPMALIGLN